jgi:hypothetical protein
MENEVESSGGHGARFFDGKKRDMGWAAKVSRRKPSLGGLTVLDVGTADAELATYLVAMDKEQLTILSGDGGGESFVFSWASGYANGRDIRIQGILEVPRA